MTHPTRQTLAEYVTQGSRQALQMQTVGQERFAREIAAGHDYEEAYRRAYGLPPRSGCLGEAQRMARLPHIVARVMQLRTASIDGLEVKREMLLENLLWAVNTARERGSTTEVRKCIESIGKLFGLVVDRIEASVMGQFTVMKEVSVNGSDLVFDVGSGAPVIIKGDRVDGQDIAKNASLATGTAQDAFKSVVNAGGTNTLLALQNTSRELPARPYEGDAVPIEALLDDIGQSGTNALQDAIRHAHKGRCKVQSAEDKEAARLLGEYS